MPAALAAILRRFILSLMMDKNNRKWIIFLIVFLLLLPFLLVMVVFSIFLGVLTAFPMIEPEDVEEKYEPAIQEVIEKYKDRYYCQKGRLSDEWQFKMFSSVNKAIAPYNMQCSSEGYAGEDWGYGALKYAYTDEVIHMMKEDVVGQNYGVNFSIDVRKLVAIDTILLEQDFSKAKKKNIKELAELFVQEEISLSEEFIDNRPCSEDEEDDNECTYWIREIEIKYKERSIQDVLDILLKEKKINQAEMEDILIVLEFIDSTFYADYEPSLIGANGWVWPTISTRVTSGFGYRQSPCKGCSSIHQGVDVGGITPGMAGDPIWSMDEGVVSYAGWLNSYGYVVFVDHQNGVQSRYAHLDSIYVYSGQEISKSWQIGRMGNTGSSTAVHLHFEIRLNGNPVDPLNFF